MEADLWLLPPSWRNERVSNAPLTTKILVGFVVLFIVIGLICGITLCGASSENAK